MPTPVSAPVAPTYAPSPADTNAQDGSDTDIVIIGRDDVSNYNPGQILPESPETIEQLRVWLQPTAYDLGSGEYRKHLGSLAPDTGDWLATSRPFAEWSHGNDHGLLWMKGIPGSGKSVLASKIVKGLTEDNPGRPVLYFFFRQIIDANHEPVALLRDWLDQVLSYSPPLQKNLKEYVENKKSLDSMSMDDLWNALRLALSGLPGKVFCVADALDEMDGGNEPFLTTLAELGNWKPEKVKVLITSRPVPAVEGPLRTANCLQIRLQENVVDVDISKFVQQGLAASNIPPEERELIREAIPGRANGLFLYAKLAMDAFLEPEASVKDVLGSLPANMDTMYMDLLREHSRRSGVHDDVQRLILQWATHATRPLRLLEMAEMVSVAYPGNATSDLSAAKDVVRAACGPLLEIMPDETVCVIHHSFTEYLKGTNRSAGHDTGYPVLRLGETHANLGLACLRYLRAGCLDELIEKKKGKKNTMKQFKSPRRLPHGSGDTDAELKLKHPFLAYARSNWHVHLERSTRAEQDQTEVNAALDRFLGNSDLADAWLDLGWWGDNGASSGIQPLHIAAQSGLVEYVKHLLSFPDVAVDAADVQGKTPLWWAASFGRAEVVQVLIEAGADPDRDDAYNGLKPLHEASSKNHPEVVKVLLAAGVDPLTKKTRERPGNWCGNARKSRGDTPLMYACQHGHYAAFEAYLPFLADNDDAVHRALAWAARSGRASILARLLEQPGVDINRKVSGETPLFCASRGRSFDAMTLLLKGGADPTILCQPDDAFSSRYFFQNHLFIDEEEHGDDPGPRGLGISQKAGFSALYMALDDRQGSELRTPYGPEEYKELLALLVEKGADIHQRTRDGKSLLHVAQANHVVVRILLDAGLDANVADNGGFTPLHKVQSTESLALLVEHGKVEINRRASSNGNTPLLQLLDIFPRAALQLIEYGADCNITDAEGNGPLHLSLQAWGSSCDVVEALLRGGADANGRNGRGERPLEMLRLDDRQALEMMDLLLRAGADINAKDRNGATSLFRIVSRGGFWPHEHPHDDIKALLDRGALLETRDFRGRTLLHELIRSYKSVSDICTASDAPDRPSRFDFLAGLGLDVRATDHDGNGLLHELCWHARAHDFDSQEILPAWDKLLALGLDVDGRNNRGRTPLHNLSTKADRGRRYRGQGTFIDAVLSRTRDVGVRDRDGVAPLHLAVTVSEYYAHKLLEAGADPTVRTNEGLTPLHLAARARQSNIVGMLLDALHRKNSAQSRVSRGSWLDNPPGKPVPVVDATDERGYTPLYYASRSGRPEIVAMLLKAGASTDVKDLRGAVTGFEREHDLWLGSGARVPDDGDTGGLGLADPSRPREPDTRFLPQLPHPFRDTARLEEIIEMLLDHGADLSDRGYNSTMTENGDRSLNATPFACRDYTLKCLSQAHQRRPLSASPPAFQRQPSSLGSFDEHLIRHRHEAATKALQESRTIKQGEANEDLFVSRLIRREYDVVEQLPGLGVDFLAKHANFGGSNYKTLVTRGYASLFDKMFSLDARAQSDKSTAGDKKRPPGDGSREGFLLQAVDQELPVLDVVRLLVEKFAVDANDLCCYAPGVGRDPVLQDSALHSLAAGHWWWQVGQALPYLISKGADLEIRNGRGQTPLHVALDTRGGRGVYHGDAARLLILAGADIRAVDAKGKTCLGYARGNIDLIRLLLQNGATVAADAVFAAIDGNQTDVLDALLAAGVSPNLRFEEVADKPWRTRQEDDASDDWERDDMPDCEWYPLHHAASRSGSIYPDQKRRDEFNKTALDMVNTLLSHGADPLRAFTRCSTKECYHQKLLAKQQADEADLFNDVEDAPAEEMVVLTPPVGGSEAHLHEQGVILHQLLVDGHVVHPLLMLPNLDANRRDGKGRTVLHAACFSPRGPDLPVNLPPGDPWDNDDDDDDDDDDNGPAYTSLFQHLLSLGADPEARDDDGRNAMHHLLRLRTENRHGPAPAVNASLAHLAAHYPSLIDQRDKDGRTPLHLAVDRAVYEKDSTALAADILLRAGADPLVADGDGDTVLHVLCRMLWVSGGLRPLFEDLVRRGCDVNARNARGETPLFGFYGQRKHGGLLRERELYAEPLDDAAGTAGLEAALEAAGADFEARDNAGRGLLHVAARGHAVRFQTLLERGLDPMLEDGERKTALDVAAACGNDGVMKLFSGRRG
ncbi:Putative NACHT nucleoside triphosphatase, P-loop containing nucleoside triphosphate hydrolase [Colletotrichum destructivum]|uniref:NACHT nucleoside triphosphatase, P-loop containing nucleoside triphosphate hydrolase n=1 Tax=Colletotrichum destructivum TaxID=34406 RepID=A0AAX4HXD7_9PEZI|nr:Putative NACHT nucleoside triphosphatase, P-loop containing nucleoside triphosphate hydrolase [Colletotrichum destructivum]